jgi:mannose-6-phosphate isomerase
MTNLDQAIARGGERLTGKRVFPSPFPLLLKLLDCADTLSVQVHPDEATCRRLGKGAPKTEYWYIIKAAPGAVIYKGLKPGVTRTEFKTAIQTGEIARTLVQIPVEAGECHFLPAGTPHAIGAGLLIAEIQMPSDTTYRVFDWNRVDENGQPRPLHVKEALESIHFDPSGDDLSVQTDGLLASCPYFRVEKQTVDARQYVRLGDGKMRALMIISGNGEITGADQPESFRSGDTFLIPADLTCIISADSPAEYLSVTV